MYQPIVVRYGQLEEMLAEAKHRGLNLTFRIGRILTSSTEHGVVRRTRLQVVVTALQEALDHYQPSQPIIYLWTASAGHYSEYKDGLPPANSNRPGPEQVELALSQNIEELTAIITAELNAEVYPGQFVVPEDFLKITGATDLVDLYKAFRPQANHSTTPSSRPSRKI